MDQLHHRIQAKTDELHMLIPISGIHHITAIASDPQRNLDFYTNVLGLRLVKRTVNFDDPGSYHFYFADELGSPGTILTFFAWPGAARGRPGAGQVTLTSFSIPEESVSFWENRLLLAGLPVEKMGQRFGEEVLTFIDPDGLKLELIAGPIGRRGRNWTSAPVPSEHAINALHSVTLCEQGYEHTANVLQTMGFRKVAEEGNRFRFEVGTGGAGTRADLLCASEAPFGRVAVGTVHHVAWRVADDDAQRLWRTHLVKSNLDVTPVMDRCYFHSIYFREPGGVLFELATDPPGFAIDESPETLGEALKLPPWLERHRSQIEDALPYVELSKPRKEEQDA
jgi:glyoxalase family protein